MNNQLINISLLPQSVKGRVEKQQIHPPKPSLCVTKCRSNLKYDN